MAGREAHSDPVAIDFVAPGYSGLHRWARAAWSFLRRKPLGAIGAALILMMLTLAAFPDLFANHPYDKLNLTHRLVGPSSTYFFGTDNQGRDVYSRVVYGARTSVEVSFGAVAIATVLSVLIGVTSGYVGGWFDTIAQRFVDIWQAFPGLVFVIFMASIFGVGERTLVITAGLLLSAGASRLIRSQTIVTRGLQFVEAARVVGASDLRIMVRHIFPNVLPLVLVNVSLQVGAVLLIEAALSFLGYGVPPPAASWGRMLREGQKEMQYHPYLAIFPGLAIALTVYGFNMLGDALRDVLDPRLRGAR